MFSLAHHSMLGSDTICNSSNPLLTDMVGSTQCRVKSILKTFQVHISLVGADKMRITWITEDSAPALVEYGTSPGVYANAVNGTTSSYKYTLYRSGDIHEVTIGPLNPDTTYYYRCSSNSAKTFSFKTPPAKLPIKFAVVGT